MATTTNTAITPAPPPSIDHILSSDLISLITATPEQINPLRGLIRQQINLAVPKDLFIAGNGQAILDWIIAHYKGKPLQRPTTAAPAGTIAVNVEFYTVVNGRVDFRRRDYHSGTINIPLGQFTGCANEEEIEEAIFSFVTRRGPDRLTVETYGDTAYGDEDDAEVDVDEDDISINSDTTELLAQIHATNPPPA